MRKLIFISIFAFLSNIAFCQSYNIKFKIEREATEKMGTEWNYTFKPTSYNPPYYVEFNGSILKISNGSKDFLNKKVITVTEKDKKKNAYGKEVTTGKDITIGVEEKGYIAYYILKYSYFESGGYIMSLYCPYILEDGMIYAYNIYQSEAY